MTYSLKALIAGINCIFIDFSTVVVMMKIAVNGKGLWSFFKENPDVFLGSSYSFLLYCVVVITYFLSIKRFQNVVIFLYFFFQN